MSEGTEPTTTPAAIGTARMDGVTADGLPRWAIGEFVRHRSIGQGRIIGYDPDQRYVILFPGGDVRHIAFTYEGLESIDGTTSGDPELLRIKAAVAEVLADHGWLDCELELGKRWVGGTVTISPGKADTASKEIPIETLFKKIIGVREKLRVLEQKINANKSLESTEKAELQGYITRAYGSLTTFNSLFADKTSHFKGQSTG